MLLLEEFNKCMDLAMRYLGYRARSAKEMSDHLRRKEMPEDAIEAVIERLREYRYIDDAQYARRFVESRIKKGGARKIAYELRQKGIDTEIIEQIVSEIDPDEALESAITYARKSLRGENNQKAKQRAWAALSRRGFSGDTIREAIGRALAEIEEDNEEDDGWE